MGANPISYTEIDAYRRMTLADLNAWDVSVIRRMDAAALAAVDGKAKAKAPKPTDPPEPIPITHTEGVRALMQGLMAKQNAKKGGQHG
jgi:hypothetical protein